MSATYPTHPVSRQSLAGWGLQLRFLSLVGLAGAILATGCGAGAPGVNTVEPAHPVYTRKVIRDKRIIRDSKLARELAVLTVFEGSSDSGLSRIGVEVQNRSSSLCAFNYRFDWFDQRGIPVVSPTATMVAQSIEPGQILVLESIAPKPDAKDFRLTLQRSNRSFLPVLPKER